MLNIDPSAMNSGGKPRNKAATEGGATARLNLIVPLVSSSVIAFDQLGLHAAGLVPVSSREPGRRLWRPLCLNLTATT